MQLDRYKYSCIYSISRIQFQFQHDDHLTLIAEYPQVLATPINPTINV